MGKTFIGNTSEKTFSNGGSIIKLGLKMEVIQEHVKNGWLNICIGKKKDAKGDGKDYYAYVDTYEPKRADDNNEPVIESTPF
jgi:hypothetical protein